MNEAISNGMCKFRVGVDTWNLRGERHYRMELGYPWRCERGTNDFVRHFSIGRVLRHSRRSIAGWGHRAGAEDSTVCHLGQGKPFHSGTPPGVLRPTPQTL